MTVLIRERTDADIPDLVHIIGRVQEQDRYPILVPKGGFDRFLTQPTSIAAWVAVDEHGTLLGHVALNAETSAPAMALVNSFDDARSAIYVSRLFVDLDRRGSGAGRGLLDHARREAVRRGCLPALDVVDIPAAADAIALYERNDWTEIGRVGFELVDADVTERVFVFVSEESR